jgi:predicted protein tyrosine phosphatase
LTAIRALFICSANMLCSPTAEHVFAAWPNVETDSAGLRIGATVRLSPEQLEWADIVFVMEQRHLAKLRDEYGKFMHAKRVVCLDIPDNYEYMDPELVKILVKKVGPYLKGA